MEENEYIENAELENVVIDGETITSQPNIDFEENHKKVGVYIKVNEQGFIVDINSDIFIENFDGWIKIDEGEGDRFVHAQTCYFDSSLIDETGNYRYRR